MTPQSLLQHSDTGDLWPKGGGAEFADAPSAYRSALAVRALRIARGETPRGCKIGFTNRTIWPRYNVYAPIWGSMWDTTAASCDGTGTLSLARLCQPRIEPEAVFGFRATPHTDANLDDLFDALDWVAPALLAEAGFKPDVQQRYIPGPRFISYHYWGEAVAA